MHLNIQKAKIFVEERLAIVQYAGMWSEVKTRYGTSLVYTNDRWADQGIVRREFKVSFNGKSITIAEMFKGKWTPLRELDEKACTDLNHVTDVLVHFTPPLTNPEMERANRRTSEAYRALTGSTGGDVSLTVSAGATKTVNVAGEPVKPSSGKGRVRVSGAKKNAPVEAAVELADTADGRARFPDNILIETGTVSKTPVGLPESAPVYGEPKCSPANHEQSVGRAKRESVHKIAMIKLVEESGIPYEVVPSKHGASYLFEGISITFSGTMLKVAALTEWNEDKHEHPFPVFSTWISGKYELAQIEQLRVVLAIAKEAARLRTMACFNLPEVVFSHSETNFVTSEKEPPAYRSRCTYISVYYRVEGFNHDGLEMVRVKSLRYSKDELMEGVSNKGANSEKVLTSSVTYSRVSDGWNDRYYNAKNPTKRMSIKCEEVTYITNRDLLNSFGLKIRAEQRDVEVYTVNVPLDRVPVKA